MRCVFNQCEYNTDGYCSSPDYITIDETGKCTQMWVKAVTVTRKYLQLKEIADGAYKIFNDNPTQANSDGYGMALNNLRDFCTEVIDKIVQQHPEITNSIIWEED